MSNQSSNRRSLVFGCFSPLLSTSCNLHTSVWWQSVISEPHGWCRVHSGTNYPWSMSSDVFSQACYPLGAHLSVCQSELGPTRCEPVFLSSVPLATHSIWASWWRWYGLVLVQQNTRSAQNFVHKNASSIYACSEVDKLGSTTLSAFALNATKL